MGRLSKRLVSIVTSVVVATSFISAMPVNINAIEVVNEAAGVEEAKAAEEVSIDEGVMLHAWNWSFNNIKDNMKEIADSGYTSIQTSPAQGARLGESWTDAVLDQTNEAPTWYYLYQPTYFKIGNAYLGTEEEFKEMCSEAKKYGVKIVVDVVLNHLADVGANGAGRVDEDLYADARRVDNGTGTRIDKWNNREQVTQGCCIGMPDINTKSEKSQKIIADYMKSLAEAGADGYRFDAAKSIELPSAHETGNTSSDFWPNIMSAVKDVNKDSFFYGEVLQGDEPGTNQDGYVNIMRITGSTYSQLVRYSVGYDVWQQEETINGKHVDVIRGEGNREGNGPEESATPPSVKNIVSAIPGAAWDQKIPGNKLVAFVETHDLYANAGATRAMSVEQREVAWAILGARKEVVPLFFNRPVDTNFGENMYKPQGSAYIPVGEKGSDDFKSPNVVAVNKFHKAMRKESEKLSGINNNMIMKAERGDKGIILANVGKNKESISTETSLADGTYENKGKDKGTFTVSGGKLTGELNGLSIAVLSAVDFDTPGDITDETKVPTISVSEKDGTIFADKLELTLKVSDAESSTYSIDGGKAVSFKDGDKVTIGEDAEDGEEISVEIVAKNGTKETKKTFKYTKKVESDIVVGDIVVKSGSKELKEGKEISFINSINITIEAKDADTSTYKVDSSKTKTFKDSVDVKIGEDAEVGDVIEVIVEATYGDEIISKTYSFIKEEEGEDVNEPVIEVTANDTEVSEDDIFEFEDEVDVTLNYDEADSATYKVGDNDEESFDDGDVITIGEDLEAGETVELTITLTNGDKEVTKIFTFKKVDKAEEKKLSIKDIIVDKKTVEVGEATNIAVEIEGSTGEVLYKFVQKSEEEEFIYSDFSKNNTIEWSEQSEGKYTIEVTVKDDNNTVTKTVEITVEDEDKEEPTDEFKVYLLNKEETIEVGKSIKLQAKAENATGTAKYLFQYQLEGTDTWYRITKDYIEESEIEWTPNKVGTYKVCVLVKDDEHDKAINSGVVNMTVKEATKEPEDPNEEVPTSDAKTLLPFAAMLALAGVTVSKTFKRKEKK